ncbi:hypothetical protein [Planococcus wigleyi]|uniref:Uncharacterized protein n=1 Tax=Planococcus wigleyi TaxID=2762216 RepID=A0ABR8W9Z0_9BACL|nr:hypothetical protein [Planococcus wigleyi]MBD8013845.1 hypothetical protein [Planococcus wigleyi]
MEKNLELIKQGKILEIPSNIKYWLLRADGGKYFDDFFLNQYVGIGNNEITLPMINEDTQLNTALGRTIEGYKNLFRKVYTTSNNQQIAHSAGRTMNFIEDMNVNDIVIVPSKQSEEFLIGVISSKPYEITSDEENLEIDGKLTRSPYLKRRDVTWIKIVNRSFISAEMRWILSAHQTIFKLSPYAEHIDNLLSPIYIKGEQCFSSIRIGTEEGVSVDQWFELYKIIKEKTGEKSDEITVKSNVRSPGYIEIVAAAVEIPTVLKASGAILGAALITGKVKLPGIEVMGIIPYFFHEGKLQRERMKLENESLKIENDLKKVDLEVKKSKITIGNSGSTGDTANTGVSENLNTSLTEELNISPFNPGTVIPIQMQTDNENLQNEDES